MGVVQIDGQVQKCNISITHTLEILQSCTKPLKWDLYDWSVSAVGLTFVCHCDYHDFKFKNIFLYHLSLSWVGALHQSKNLRLIFFTKRFQMFWPWGHWHGLPLHQAQNIQCVTFPLCESQHWKTGCLSFIIVLGGALHQQKKLEVVQLSHTKWPEMSWPGGGGLGHCIRDLLHCFGAAPVGFPVTTLALQNGLAQCQCSKRGSGGLGAPGGDGSLGWHSGFPGFTSVHVDSSGSGTEWSLVNLYTYLRIYQHDQSSDVCLMWDKWSYWLIFQLELVKEVRV